MLIRRDGSIDLRVLAQRLAFLSTAVAAAVLLGVAIAYATG